MTTLPARLQRFLEHTYCIDTHLDVGDFLLTDPGIAQALAPMATQRGEALLVRETADGLDVSLFVDPSYAATLGAQPPVIDVGDPRLDAFCRLTEGISHFVLLTWRARRGRPISHLELELQAEVDKYVVCWLMGLGNHKDLLEALFVNITWHEDLEDHERHRYETAHEWAHTFCRSLASHDQENALRTLRRFYRLGQREKVGHIATLAHAA